MQIDEDSMLNSRLEETMGNADVSINGQPPYNIGIHTEGGNDNKNNSLLIEKKDDEEEEENEVFSDGNKDDNIFLNNEIKSDDGKAIGNGTATVTSSQESIVDANGVIPSTQPISDIENDYDHDVNNKVDKDFQKKRSNSNSNSNPNPNPMFSLSNLNSNHTATETQYKGQPVWSVLINDITFMKKMDDLSIQFSPILQLIRKISPSGSNSQLDKVSDGILSYYKADENGDYWIPQKDVISLLGEYNIKDLLVPLFTIDASPESSTGHSDNKKKRSIENQSSVLESPTKKTKPNLLDDGIFIFGADMIDHPSYPNTLKPLLNDSITNEHSKVVISSLFLPFQNEATLEQVLKNEVDFLNPKDVAAKRNDLSSKDDNKSDNEPFNRDDINVDVPIDDNGQTALHLAATLGKVSLVKELLEKGSNIFRGDNDGQTALIRVVHATNCFELSCFDKLLDLLYPSLKLLDNRGRTILHHIALNCGLKGRYDASKYYLETLLEWVVKKGSKIPNFKLTLKDFIGDVVNKADKYGNNCLNYATLSGNKYIISQLLEVCADPNKPNKIGVTPKDWGIDVHHKVPITGQSDDNEAENKENNAQLSLIDAGYTENGNVNVENNIKSNTRENAAEGSNSNHGETFKETSSNSVQILNSIQSFISNIGKEFKDELLEKSQQIEKLNPVLREKTIQLSQKRKQFDELQAMVRKISKITNKIDNLNKAINEEEEKFQEEAKILNIQIEDDNCLGNFDADQPFTISSMYNDVEEIVDVILKDRLKDQRTSLNKDDLVGELDVNSDAIIAALDSITEEDILTIYENKLDDSRKESIKEEIPPTVVLDARIRAYEKNNKILLEKRNSKKNSNKELETQFKRIIGLCIGTDPNEIDDRLLSSLLMSVENDPDPEIGQIKKVLKIVGDLDTDISRQSSPARK